MQTLQINQWKIPFEIQESKRAKRMSLKIVSEKRKLIMVIPRWTMKFQINAFLKQQEGWVEKNWEKMEQSLAKRPTLEHSETYYKNKAKVLIRERLKYFNQFYNLDYNRVFFRNQRTRWGSCSSNKNLNFNWRLILAPLEILDYVIVHELCHLKHMNHSEHFWSLVEKQVPDYKPRRKWLKDNHYLLTVD